MKSTISACHLTFIHLIFAILLSITASTLQAQKTNPAKAPNSIAAPNSGFKNFSLRFDRLIQKNELNHLPKLNQAQTDSWKIQDIDAFYEPSYVYHFLDTVAVSEKHLLALIAREYANENIIWLCKYDQSGKMIHADQVYYDNAEGNYLLESTLKNNILTLYSEDVNEGKRKKVHRIDAKLNIIPPIKP